jgi:xanthine/uracil permease
MERHMWITIAWWVMFFYSLCVGSFREKLFSLNVVSAITLCLGLLMVATIWGSAIWCPEHGYYGDKHGPDYESMAIMQMVVAIITALFFALFFGDMDLIIALFLYYPILIAEGIIIFEAYYNYKTKTI